MRRGSVVEQFVEMVKADGSKVSEGLMPFTLIRKTKRRYLAG